MSNKKTLNKKMEAKRNWKTKWKRNRAFENF